MLTVFKTLLRSPKFLIGAIILFLILAFMTIYPQINPNDPSDMITRPFEPPSSELLLGSDNFGRNVLLQLAYGTRTSLTVGLIAGIIATIIGLSIGLFSGYVGGLIDDLLTAVTNIFIVIPPLVILILVAVSIGTRSLFLMGGVIGITSWPWSARAVRAQAVSLRNREHVHLAKISGFSLTRILATEILPYIASYVVMVFIIQVASGILMEALASMLGLGPHGLISLGILLNWALMFEAPRLGAWWAFLPAAAIMGMLVFSLYLINLGMDEIFDPKARS